MKKIKDENDKEILDILDFIVRELIYKPNR